MVFGVAVHCINIVHAHEGEGCSKNIPCTSIPREWFINRYNLSRVVYVCIVWSFGCVPLGVETAWRVHPRTYAAVNVGDDVSDIAVERLRSIPIIRSYLGFPCRVLP